MTHDPALSVLMPLLQSAPGPVLWVADENALDAVTRVTPRPGLQVLSNRYDVAMAAQAAGHHTQFSDFDFTDRPDNSLQCIAYRVSKEKPVVHHVLNHAPRLLDCNGTLLLAGMKNEGAKSYIDKCRQHFGNGVPEKHGMGYLGQCRKPAGMPGTPWLDDQDYRLLRNIPSEDMAFISKPGTFGWNKIDEGSALLAATLPQALQQASQPPQSLLDLGCGYGFLTLATRQIPLARRVATDNAAAALLAMQANAELYGLAVDAVPSDAGNTIHDSFDLILCNPPFHQGFTADTTLNDKFLRHSRRLLANGGMALFVVNRFIPLAQHAAAFFHRCDKLAENRSFSVFLLRP